MESPNLRPASIAGGLLDHYFHTCALFREPDEEYRVLAPFLSEGLAGGEKAIYMIDPARRAEHLERLQQHGVRLPANPGQFELLTWADTYLRDGRFDKDLMLTAVHAAIEAGRQQGYPRTRIVGQMDWAFQGHPGSEQLMEYEVQVNEVLSRTRHPTVCVYDVNRLDGSTIMDLLRVHPMTIVRGTLYENPFYEPAERMLEELRRRRVAA
jgi:MEDS: MEthanogen/methylotroph, DcmR Sensory domain